VCLLLGKATLGFARTQVKGVKRWFWRVGWDDWRRGLCGV